MARKKKQNGSIRSYFRKLFEENPAWLDDKSNDAILDRYRVDYNLAQDAAVDNKIRANLANLKSNMRKAQRQSGSRGSVLSGSIPSTGGSGLERLEEMIDECLTLAKTMDREGLENVIKLLRRARNEVVWRIGQ